MNKAMAHAVRKLAGKQVPVVTLETLTTQIANRKTSSTYLHAQLPPLLARMAVALGEEAPASLASMPSLASLIQWYGDSALRIAELPPPPEWGAWRENPSKTFLAREAAFDDTLETIRREGKLVRDRLFEAIEEAGGLYGSAPDGAAGSAVDAFLGDFYAKRLTLRLLLGQHKACGASDSAPGFHLRQTFDELDLDGDGVLDADELARARSLYGASSSEPRPSVCGLVDSAMSPFDVAVQVIADVREECLRSPRNPGGLAPPFKLYGNGRGVTLPYLPRHLYIILREVLRNSVRASLLKHAADGDALGEISVVISDGDANSDVVVKVADLGGGIPRSRLRRIFAFSAERNVARDLADQKLCVPLGVIADEATDILATRVGGHGLPLARVYATLFNGDLQLRSMEGHGTDAYVYISKIQKNVLPT